MFTLPANAKPYTNCYLLVVTPEMARQWLNRNSFNRPLKPRLVDKYVRQINAGNWHRTHQGVAFDPLGVIVDGQHRLWAIVQSGKAVPILIFLNEDSSVHESIDGGRSRSLLDVVRLELRDNTIKNRHILVAKAMWAGRYCANQDDLTAAEVGNLLRNFHSPIRFAVDLLERSNVENNVVMGVLARAYQTVPQEQLLEFSRILRTGNGSHPSTKIVLAFRNWLLCLKDRQEATRRDIYKRTETVLDAFLKNQTTCDMVADHKEFYPLYGNTPE
jgi:hypothetical protein